MQGLRTAGRVLALLAVLVAVAGFGAPAASASTAASVPCAATASQSLRCYEVDVPLDRSGAVAGTVPLHVEVSITPGVQRGVMFMLAGGPGQGSAYTFDLGSPEQIAFYRFLFPGYTLVAYDDRGTGSSGLLQCPVLQAAVSSANEAALAAGCAASLGPNRDYYTTADHAEDLEAVRAALGFDKIGIWGVSYGTKLALAYALAHPDHVERLLLDSVLPTSLVEPFGGNVLRALPATLAAYCARGACNAATSNFPGDVVALANRLAASPLHGNAPAGSGGTKTITLSGVDFLGLVVEMDLNPGLAAELPAAVHAALKGVTRPLLRLVELDNETGQETAQSLSEALFAATVCHDGPFPWQPDTPLTERPALYQAAVAALPAGSLGPFGTWAAQFGDADLCLDWPVAAGDATLGAGPLPNVPVLALSGGLDLRTPTSSAAAVVAGFPQGHLLVVPGVGHSVVTADPSGCAQRAVHDWMLGAQVPAQCTRAQPYVTAVPSYPTVPAAKRHNPSLTLSVAAKTLHEAEAAWLMATGVSDESATVAAPYGGTLVARNTSRFTLKAYSVAPGVTVSGAVSIVRFGPPISFSGRLKVAGAAAAAGTLQLAGSSLAGRLGGKSVGS